MFDRIADCFTDHRDPRLIEHSVATLVAQRIVGLAQWAYEDLNDHDHLRRDPVLGLLAGKLGGDRKERQEAVVATAPGISWSRARRLIAKAEHIAGKPNPRFLVTSLPEHHLFENRLRAHLLSPGATPRTPSRNSSSTSSSPIHVVTSMDRPGRYQPERQMLGGIRTHQEKRAFPTAH